jgi:hypothetical protein
VTEKRRYVDSKLSTRIGSYTTAAEFLAAVKRDRWDEWAANLARLAEEQPVVPE